LCTYSISFLLSLITEDKLRKKWKYFRDQFGIEVSKLKRPWSGDEGGKTQTSKWQYFKSLYFLRDIIKSRPTSGKHISLPWQHSRASLGVCLSNQLSWDSATAIDASHNSVFFFISINIPECVTTEKRPTVYQ
jgi:hypothetical protein